MTVSMTMMKKIQLVICSLMVSALLLGLSLVIAPPARAAAPYVVGITRLNPAGPSTNASSVTFRVTFSESVSGVDADDFSLTATAATGTVSGIIDSVSAAGGTTVDVTVYAYSMPGSAGTLRLDLKDGGTGIVNGAGDPISGGYSFGETYIIDRTVPTVTVNTNLTAGGDGWVNIAEKAVGFQVVARSNEASVTFYVAPYDFFYTPSTIASAAVASATSGGAGTDTVINVSGNNPGILDGKEYYVYAVDAAGNISSTYSSTVAFATDLTAPFVINPYMYDVWISSSQKVAGFTVQVRCGSEGGTCYLVPSDTTNDIGAITRSAIVIQTISGGFSNITVPANNEGLLDGTTYKVYVVDRAGNISVPATVFTTDFTPPTVSVNAAATAGGDGYVNNYEESFSTVVVTARCSETAATLYLVPAGTANDAISIRDAAVVYAFSAGPGEDTVLSVSSWRLRDGTVYKVYAVDFAYNVSAPATAFTTDFTGPTVSVNAGLTAGGDGMVNGAEKMAGFNVVARSSEGTGTLYLVQSDNPNIVVASAASAGANADTTIVVGANNPLITNGKSYAVMAVDAAGNGTMLATAFTADLTAPTVSVDGGDHRLVDATAKVSSFQVSAVCNKTSGHLYLVPSGTAANITAITNAAIATTGWSGAYSSTYIPVPANSVTDGTAYVVYAVDMAGNISPVPAAAFTADLTVPTGSATYVRSGNTLLITVTFSEAMDVSATPMLTVIYTGGISTLGPNAMTRVNAMTYTYSLILPTGTGVGTLSLHGRDLAGNPVTETPTAGSSFIVDSTAPTVSLNPGATAGGDGIVNIAEKVAGFDVVARSSKATGSLCLVPSGTANNLGAILSASIAGAASAGADADTTIHVSAGNPGIIDGTTYKVYAIDGAGNISAISGAAFTADLTAPAVSSVGVPADGTYLTGQNLDFTAIFNESVTVNTSGGTPYLTVTLDSGTVRAYYVSGSGTTALTFRYTVVSGDFDSDGIGVAGGISANGGALKDAAGNDAGLTLTNIGDARFVRVDATVPAVVSINRQTPAGALTNATSVIYRVTFNKSVTGVDTGDFALIATGTTSGIIASVSAGSGTSVDVTVNSIAGNGTLRLDLKSSGTGIADSRSTAIDGGFTAGQSYTFDHTAPTVTSVNVPANGTYLTGQNLDFTVNFGEAVTVDTSGGTPYIPVVLNTGGTVHASYISGSGTAALVFRYTVVNGNNDPDGIGLGAIAANGGQIRDAAGNSANLTLNGAGSTAGVRVDAVAPTVASVDVPADGAYLAGQDLDFTVHFSEAVVVDTLNGAPRISIAVGSRIRYADYVSGSGGNALLFRYTIVPGDQDSDGIALNALALNGSTVRDAAGNNAALGLNGVGATGGVWVDAIGPTVVSVDVPASAVYIAGQGLDFTVHFSEAVTVDVLGGTPYIPITLDSGGTVQARYLSGSGTDNLLFRYVVAAGDEDANGIAIGNSITANVGVLRDSAGNDVALRLNGVGAIAGIRVDAVAPTVDSVDVPAPGTYTNGQNLNFTINFHETVTVDISGGRPRIAVVLDNGGTVYADYIGGSGTSSLTFRYTIISGQADATGIDVGALTSHGGTIKDAAGNDAVLTLHDIGDTTGVRVDASAPMVSLVAVPATGAYRAGQNLDFTVSFEENVTVDTTGGTPYITVTLDTGGAVRADYVSGSGTSALVFRYTVSSGDSDANGVSLGSTIIADGGTIKDAAGNNAVLALNNIAGTSGVRVDTDGPQITFVKPTDGASINTSTGSMVIVNLSDAISGIDASSIQLQIDGGAWTNPISFPGNTAYFLLGQMSNGSHTITVRVRDNAGNETTLSITITWDHYRRGFGFGRFNF